jgi:very-short-patch-repair endonuclease
VSHLQKPVFRKRNTERSRELRRSASPAEKRLWSKLCRGQINDHRFTTQFQIGEYYGDIVCRKAKLVVEVDGWSHDISQAYDARRDQYMQSIGYRILRFTNEDVMKNLEGVVVTIAAALTATPSPNPSRKREGS